MARIRSIKPEFFTSEVVACLPISARLTFVGLWTYVDDNGVGLANPRLINAAIWPLEDDPTAALRRTLEDLQSLSEAGLIVLYESFGKRLIFVKGWDEHQKVSHPKKPRYVRPSSEQFHSDIAFPPESSSENDSSGDPPETLLRPLEIVRPEQGSGSRDQGAGKNTYAPDEPERQIHTSPDSSEPIEPKPKRSPKPGSDQDPDWVEFYAAYPLKKSKEAARKAWARAIKRVDPSVIIAAAQRYRDDPGRDPAYTKHPATWLNGGCWDDEATPVPATANGSYRPYQDPDPSEYFGRL